MGLAGSQEMGKKSVYEKKDIHEPAVGKLT